MYIKISKEEKILIKDKLVDESVFEDEDKLLFIYGKCRKGIRLEDKNIINKILSDFTHETISDYLVGGYFLIYYNKRTQLISMIRDISGLKTGYYHYDPVSSTIYVSTNMHQIAQNIDTDFCEFSLDFFLYQSYIPNGYTLYKEIFEVKVGELLNINLKDCKLESEISPLPIKYSENEYSEAENIARLRELTIAAHEELAGEHNTVYLSGGIDSCAMLAALYNISPKSIRNISYRVVGTPQDEIQYAKIVAEHLGYSLDIIDVDPNRKDIASDFENEIQSYNNPYLGNWIFSPDSKYSGERFFAGQDTRLHTPAIDKFDDKIFGNISKGKRFPLGKLISGGYDEFSELFRMYKSTNRLIRNSHIIISMLDSSSYLSKRKFHCDKQRYTIAGYSTKNRESIEGWYELELSKGMSKREINNRIVAKKWEEQYINDIRYMVDMGRSKGVTTFLPFYQDKMNLFASTIPWDMANKRIEGLSGFGNRKVKVNKYVLRKAFEKELPWEIMVRDKSVSLSAFLILNGPLGQEIKRVITKDIQSSDSFCYRFDLSEHAKKILSTGNWNMRDDFNFPLYLACLCVYYEKNIIKKS